MQRTASKQSVLYVSLQRLICLQRWSLLAAVVERRRAGRVGSWNVPAAVAVVSVFVCAPTQQRLDHVRCVVAAGCGGSARCSS